MTKGFESCVDLETRRSGNYHYEENIDGVYEVYYHSTVILAFSPKDNIYFCDDRGWNTSSTHRAMSGADEKMQKKGYTKVSVDEFKSITGARCYAQ